jgi:Sec-independent protein translocase protein TatA
LRSSLEFPQQRISFGLPAKDLPMGEAEMTEFWIVLVVAMLIFATSRIGDLGEVIRKRLKGAKNTGKESRGGEQKS